MKRFSTMIFAVLLSLGTLTAPLAIMAQAEDQTIKQTQEQAVVAPDAPAVEVQSGQSVVAPEETPKISDGELFQALAQFVMDSIQVVKKEGASKIGIVIGLIFLFSQLLIRFSNKIFERVKLSDGMKQVIVAVCTVVVTAIPMYQGGANWAAILSSGTVMTAMSFAFFAIGKAWFPSLLEKLGLKQPAKA